VGSRYLSGLSTIIINFIEGKSMCGIAGLIHRGKSSNVGSELQGMLQALKHRGEDSTVMLYMVILMVKFYHAFKVEKCWRELIYS